MHARSPTVAKHRCGPISFRGFALLFIYKWHPYFSGYCFIRNSVSRSAGWRLRPSLLGGGDPSLAAALMAGRGGPSATCSQFVYVWKIALSPLRLPVLSSLEAIDLGLTVVSLECCWLLKSFNRNEKWHAELGSKSFQQFLCVPNVNCITRHIQVPILFS